MTPEELLKHLDEQEWLHRQREIALGKKLPVPEEIKQLREELARAH